MNVKLLIGFLVVVLLVFVLPIVVGVVRATTAGGEMGGPPPAGPKAAPLLDAGNLAGSVWNVKTPEIPIAITITLNAGGQAVATVPPMFSALAKSQIGTDRLTGSWSVQGDKLKASVEFQGKRFEVDCDIIGDKLYYDNREIPRVI
ncbi:MAG: hypothetical protein ACOYI9_10390 [Candidatus Hydrogenedentales bacterium]|jgi:hypothetical protein